MKGHIQKRGKSWRLKYETAADAATGKRKTAFATFRGSKREAQNELVRLMDTVRRGEHVDTGKLTVAEYFDRWEKEWVATQVSPKTGEGYIEKLRLHVRPHIGAMRLSKVQDADLNKLYAMLFGKGLAARTVGHVHRVIHKAFEVAVVDMKLIPRNPASNANPPKLPDTDEVVVLTAEETHLILRRLRGRSIYPLIVVLMATGMRRGELLALRWRDVNFDACTVRIERSIEQTKNGLRIKGPKTKYGKRTIDVPPSIMAELKTHWTAQQEQRLKLGLGGAGDDDLVFATFDGSLRNPNAFTHEWAAVRDALKLPKVTLHAFRHTHASSIDRSRHDGPLVHLPAPGARLGRDHF